VKGWVIPPEKSARFVWRMEEVLDLYEEPYDEERPVVCFDERPCQLLADLREPLGLRAGRPGRRDHEYARRGMAQLFVAFEPLTGWRGVQVRERRRGREFAEFVGHLAEEIYPKAEKIRLVLDNLNIHSAASFYEVFDAERARRLSRRIEFRYTPVHGSWLNMAEIEISVLVRQCLGKRRVPDAKTLGREAQAWCKQRNRLGVSVDWRFSTADARTKLRRLYPSIER
jgi:DDE superfamily endonuclease